MVVVAALCPRTERSGCSESELALREGICAQGQQLTPTRYRIAAARDRVLVFSTTRPRLKRIHAIVPSLSVVFRHSLRAKQAKLCETKHDAFRHGAYRTFAHAVIDSIGIRKLALFRHTELNVHGPVTAVH